jgi:hypothetical protein
VSWAKAILKDTKQAVRRATRPFVANDGAARGPSSRRVVVSSNCQTAGIAAALQVIFPQDEFVPIPLPSFASATDEEAFVRTLRQCDLWISIGSYDLPSKHGLDARDRLIKIPRIRFSGFHPDLVYARRISNKQLVAPHYNSAIAIWAYRNGIGVADAKCLFNIDTFAGLGYLNSWEPSVASLRLIFQDTDIDFSEFFLAVRREGLFMYSLNHPKILTLTWLAKLVARRMGAEPDVLERSIDVNDGLSDIIWPIYPGVGDELGLPSRYEWKVGSGKWISGLDAFLEDAFLNYANQGIGPDDISAVQVDESLFDRVLGEQLDRNHG